MKKSSCLILWMIVYVALTLATNSMAGSGSNYFLVDLWQKALSHTDLDLYAEEDIRYMSEMIYYFRKTKTLRKNWMKYKLSFTYERDINPSLRHTLWFKQDLCQDILKGNYLRKKDRTYYPQRKKKPNPPRQEMIKKTTIDHHCYVRLENDTTLDLQWIENYFPSY
ncbi:MAG: hypothetical protein R3A45_05555 [Bdellovibrionota bacterium]